MTGLRPGLEWGSGDETHASNQSEQRERAVPPQVHQAWLILVKMN
jgi:hypothetical protein